MTHYHTCATTRTPPWYSQSTMDHSSFDKDPVGTFTGTTTISDLPRSQAHSVELPDWLSVPDPKRLSRSQQSKELLHAEYTQLFERVVESIYRGHSMQKVLLSDPRFISCEDFMRWVKRDPIRFERYKEAHESYTEFTACEIKEIADGVDSIDPNSSDAVNRDRLRIDTRKWLMSAHNRKRYGDTKQIDVNGSISITAALAQAQERLISAEITDVVDVGHNSYDQIEHNQQDT